MLSKSQIPSSRLLLGLAGGIVGLMLQAATVQAASLNPASTLSLAGTVQITTTNASDPGDTLLFFPKNPITGADINPPAPVGFYGGYTVQTSSSDVDFAGLAPNSASYQIASISKVTSPAPATPFLKIGQVGTIGNVDFDLQNITTWSFLPVGGGRSILSVEGTGIFKIDGTNANLGVGSFSSQFLVTSALPSNRSYSGTFQVEVVPEPTEVAGILCLGLIGGAASLRRTRRSSSAL